MGCVESSQNPQLTNQRKTQIQRMKRQLVKKNKEITLLQKQNNQLKKKRQERVHQVKQPIKINDVQIIQFQEDGKNQDNKDQQTQLQDLLKCTLCEQEYNLRSKIPWMVCVNQHTYCNDCVSRMMQRNHNKCPECRQEITSGNRNLHLCLLLQNTNAKQGKINGKSKSSNSVPKQLNISVNKQNRYYNQYTIYQPNTIVKGVQSCWYGLLFNQVLPVEGTFRFSFEVVFSLHNNVEVGIIDLSSKVEKGKMSNKRITYHLYDGKVMDSGNIDTAVTGWRPLGQPVPRGVSSKIIVQVNMDDNIIRWIINDKLHAQTVITNYIKYAKAVPYLSLYHTDDVVNINVW